jgi:hypothetical protein
MGRNFPNLTFSLRPILSGMAVVAAFLLIDLIGSLRDLLGNVNRLPSHGVRNAPFDHRNLQGIVHD